MAIYPHRFLEWAVAEDIAARGLNRPHWPDPSDDRFLLVLHGIKGLFAHG
jgi:hypothetical protein